MAEAFDLNTGEVLEHWPTYFAVREIIANALDEQVLTDSQTPDIIRIAPNRWAIRDYGRGVHYSHLTQSENQEKINHPAVIGKFGFGLNDALAVLDRRGIGVTIRSKHARVTTAVLQKGSFDVQTLHAVVEPTDNPEMVGTEVILDGVSDEDVRLAKECFLGFSTEPVLETTRYGEVVAKASPDAPGLVYVKGLRVAEEPAFLFSYNVLQPDAKLNRALNRERSNVGRTAYSDRIKDILKTATTKDVLSALAEDISRFREGEAMHDELRWKDVAVYACQALQVVDRALFVTADEVGEAHTDYAKSEGYRIVVVPNDIAKALAKTTDTSGKPMLTLRQFRREWAESFVPSYVEVDDLDVAERAVFELAPKAAAVVGFQLDSVVVRISETMRPTSVGVESLGLWDPRDRTIVIKRSELRDASAFLGTFLHEVCHATCPADDRTIEFEEALTDMIGRVAAAAVGRG